MARYLSGHALVYIGEISFRTCIASHWRDIFQDIFTLVHNVMISRPSEWLLVLILTKLKPSFNEKSFYSAMTAYNAVHNFILHKTYRHFIDIFLNSK